MQKPSLTAPFRPQALCLAITSLLIAGSASAGKIDNINNHPDPNKLGVCVAVDNPSTPDVDESTLAPAACIGAWNLDNVNVNGVRTDTGAESTDFFDKLTGLYRAMVEGDSFVSVIRSALGDAGEVMARLTGKDWPVGEPTGIKAVNGDTQTKNGKPENCLINTSYLGASDSQTGEDAYLDSASPEPVICSSGFQSHKRFKIAMQPATTAGIADGAEGKPIDLVFNVSDNGALTPYQVFSKINNYTEKRLRGYRIVVGQGLGDAFQSAAQLGIEDKLHISLGVGEGGTTTTNQGIKTFTPDGSNLFDADGLATFSHGLFGAADQNFPSNGFFDNRTAGFNAVQSCSVVDGCATYSDPLVSPLPLMAADTIESTTVLPSNYSSLFGNWLPSKWQPSGVFFDDDSDPTTDPVLMAWWNGSAWVQNNDAGFAPVPSSDLAAWAANPLYEVAQIEDVLNLGINYIVKVGDGIGSNFTVRITPLVATDQSAPAFLAAEPAPLEPQAPPAEPDTTTTGDGGGCSAATVQRPVDPMLPALGLLGLIGLGLRRMRRR